MESDFDIFWVRAQFPALTRGPHAGSEVFFDGPGGTQVPNQVIQAVSAYLAGSNSNLHGPFRTSRETGRVVEEAHRAAADFLGCTQREVVFGPNMTTLTFWLSRALSTEFEPGDEIVVTRLDHDANHAPWKSLEEQGLRVLEARFNRDDCTLDLADLRNKLTSRTKLVAVGYASNAVGTVNDIRRLPMMPTLSGHACLWMQCTMRRTARSTCGKSAATSWRVRRTSSSARTKGCSMGGKITWSAFARTRCVRPGTACPGVSRPALKTTNAWPEQPPLSTTWRLSGNAAGRIQAIVVESAC